MITVKTTSGFFTMDDFQGRLYLASAVLAEARLLWPHANFEIVTDAATGKRYKGEEWIPDGYTVHVLSAQPVDA